MNINSTNIRSADYNTKDYSLTVTFHSGHSHTYHQISPAEYSAFLNANSAGQHLHRHFKSKKSTRLQ